MAIQNLRDEYINKKFVMGNNPEQTILIIDLDELYMTVKVIKGRCIAGDILRYPLTALPVLIEVQEQDKCDILK